MIKKKKVSKAAPKRKKKAKPAVKAKAKAVVRAKAKAAPKSKPKKASKPSTVRAKKKPASNKKPKGLTIADLFALKKQKEQEASAGAEGWKHKKNLPPQDQTQAEDMSTKANAANKRSGFGGVRHH